MYFEVWSIIKRSDNFYKEWIQNLTSRNHSEKMSYGNVFPFFYILRKLGKCVHPKNCQFCIDYWLKSWGLRLALPLLCRKHINIFVSFSFFPLIPNEYILVWPMPFAHVLLHPQLIFPSKTWFYGIYLNFQWQKSFKNQYLPHFEYKSYQINSIKSYSSRSSQQHQRHFLIPLKFSIAI